MAKFRSENEISTLTMDQELALVNDAKNGDVAARDQLFITYIGEIEYAHIFSAVGTNPVAFGRGYNKHGMNFDSDMGRLFLIFVNALEKFDINMVDMSKIKKTNPFLSYLKYEIAHRALDMSGFKTKYRKRHVSVTEHLQKMRENDEIDGGTVFTDDDVFVDLIEKSLNKSFDKSDFYHSLADDLQNLQLHDMLMNIRRLFPDQSREQKFIATYLCVAKYENNVMPVVAKMMGVSKPTAYKILKNILDCIPPQMVSEYRCAFAA